MNDLSQKNPSEAKPVKSFIQNDPAASLLNFEETGAGEKCLIFFLNGEILAVSAGNVSEVVVPLKVTPLPGMPEWFSGIANLRGKIISVMDLSKFWRKDKTSLSPKSKFILLSSKKSDLQIAFIVDRINEVVVLPFSEIQPGGNAAPFFRGKFRHQTGFAALLDAEKLLSALNSGN